MERSACHDGTDLCLDFLSSGDSASCRMTPDNSSHKDTFMLQETSAIWNQPFCHYILCIAA